MSARPNPHRAPVQVTVVESAGCHHCQDAHALLDQLVRDGHGLDVRTVDLRAREGQELMRRHGAAMSPLVLVEGRFFSQGRLPRGKLHRLLGDSTRPAPTAGARA